MMQEIKSGVLMIADQSWWDIHVLLEVLLHQAYVLSISKHNQQFLLLSPQLKPLQLLEVL